jgi:IS30 family transposase
MARHLTISRTLGVPVYFCGSRSLRQRGNNENMTRLVHATFRRDLWLYSPVSPGAPIQGAAARLR